jgi:hypothetical protein
VSLIPRAIHGGAVQHTSDKFPFRTAHCIPPPTPCQHPAFAGRLATRVLPKAQEDVKIRSLGKSLHARKHPYRQQEWGQSQLHKNRLQDYTYMNLVSSRRHTGSAVRWDPLWICIFRVPAGQLGREYCFARKVVAGCRSCPGKRGQSRSFLKLMILQPLYWATFTPLNTTILRRCCSTP